MPFRQNFVKKLAGLDIEINGSRPWDIKIHNDKLFFRAIHGTLGLGEAYMDGWWDVEQLDVFFTKILRAGVQKKFMSPRLIWNYIYSSLLNAQSKARSSAVAKKHYDLGNDFYSAMLDKNMQYTCAYWKNAKSLEQAQEQKLDLICRKLELKKGEKVLELGCGWGGFAHYAAKNYGVSVVAYNISEEQVKYARERNKGLPVTIVKADYREATGTYDKVASIGLCEHVGYKNYRVLMETVNRCLKDDGLFLLHTIGSNVSTKSTDPWIQKYIFPNSMLPSLAQLTKAAVNLFVMEDMHNFGADYDKTLMAWDKNFRSNWPKFKDKYGERFYRMWRLYLMSSAGQFRSRKIQLWQIIFSKGKSSGYNSIR